MPRGETIQVCGHTVTVTRRSAAKRMTLRVDEKRNGFALTVPVRATAGEISGFLAKQAEWMNARSAERLMTWTPAYAPGERHLMLGRRVTLGKDGVPSGNAFAVARQRALEALIRELLPRWQAVMGVRASVVRFRNMRSRWGSCQTVKREIHLSTFLGMMPGECVEYVLVHELCHLLHADHSPAFHAAMTRFMPDWPARKKRLNAVDKRPWPPEK